MAHQAYPPPPQPSPQDSHPHHQLLHHQQHHQPQHRASLQPGLDDPRPSLPPLFVVSRAEGALAYCDVDVKKHSSGNRRQDRRLLVAQGFTAVCPKGSAGVKRAIPHDTLKEIVFQRTGKREEGRVVVLLRIQPHTGEPDLLFDLASRERTNTPPDAMVFLQHLHAVASHAVQIGNPPGFREETEMKLADLAMRSGRKMSGHDSIKAQAGLFRHMSAVISSRDKDAAASSAGWDGHSGNSPSFAGSGPAAPPHGQAGRSSLPPKPEARGGVIAFAGGDAGGGGHAEVDDVERTAEELHQAMSANDEAAVMHSLLQVEGPEQWHSVKGRYAERYGRDLVAHLHSDLPVHERQQCSEILARKHIYDLLTDEPAVEPPQPRAPSDPRRSSSGGGGGGRDALGQPNQDAFLSDLLGATSPQMVESVTHPTPGRAPISHPSSSTHGHQASAGVTLRSAGGSSAVGVAPRQLAAAAAPAPAGATTAAATSPRVSRASQLAHDAAALRRRAEASQIGTAGGPGRGVGHGYASSPSYAVSAYSSPALLPPTPASAAPFLVAAPPPNLSGPLLTVHTHTTQSFRGASHTPPGRAHERAVGPAGAGRAPGPGGGGHLSPRLPSVSGHGEGGLPVRGPSAGAAPGTPDGAWRSGGSHWDPTIAQRLAAVIHQAMAGLGTAEDAIFRVLEQVGSQGEWDSVRREFSRSSNADLVGALKGDLSQREIDRCAEILGRKGVSLEPFPEYSGHY